ncbi:MAG: ATP-binding protein [Methanomassiliicoccales archaeon]|jgi:SpoVK/Ycf46/Vps4 family AAA+-type ATPase
MPDANDKSNKPNVDIAFSSLIANSPAFQELKHELLVAVRLSLTGITNLVVNYEDPCLVDDFLSSCYKSQELYRETINIDSVELQQGAPGQGYGSSYIDKLIFGTIEMLKDVDGLETAPSTDAQTGKRRRNMNGFVNRKEVLTGKFKDKLLIIKNIDYSLDFCQIEPGVVDARSLWILDQFRNPTIKKGCRLLLVTNKKLVFPFQIRVVNFPFVDDYEANHLIDSFVSLYTHNRYDLGLNSTQRTQLVRKICGLTYTEAGDAMVDSFSHSESPRGSRKIDCDLAVRNLREKINRNFMENSTGLTHLNAKPWDDYICPESSNFTFDVRKILRDFEEVRKLKTERDNIVHVGGDDASISQVINAIQTRMPHVIVLYGKGGVGKSAFPLHFAGLLDLDVWDFNINATHSKWVGEGSERIRSSLNKISKASHLVVRIDEYDRAIGATDGGGQGMHEAHKQVESEFMNWLQNSQEDNMFVQNNIFLVLTTNHKEFLTGPLLRSGRADLVIDIANFDAQSMKEAFLSAPRRMEHRGIDIVGFSSPELLLRAIEKLDIEKMAQLSMSKGFTVRDVDILLMEMAAHDYYYKKEGNGIPWTTESFIKVLENSIGSAKGTHTNELILGDRQFGPSTEIDNSQLTFGFSKVFDQGFDPVTFKRVDFFKETPDESHQ